MPSFVCPLKRGKNMSKINVPDEFILSRGNQKFIRFGGLLHVAHQMGNVSIKTEWVNKDSWDKENPFLVFKAEVCITDKDVMNVSTGYGDASTKNTGKMIWPHLLRMAETRAIVRALRFATGISMTALEELGGEE